MQPYISEQIVRFITYWHFLFDYYQNVCRRNITGILSIRRKIQDNQLIDRFSKTLHKFALK